MKQLQRSHFKSCLGLSLCFYLFGVVGCGEEAQQLYEVAEFEELQNNQKHARELYQRIIEIDPNGYLATKARERIAELDKKVLKKGR